MIAGVEGREDVSRAAGVACRCVEVNHAIERLAGADPLVDGLALLLLIRAIVVLKLHTCESVLERRQRGADDAHPVDMGARDQLLVAIDDVIR